MKKLLLCLLLIPNLAFSEGGVEIILKNPASITVGLTLGGQLKYPTNTSSSKAMGKVATSHCKKYGKYPVKVAEKAMPNGYSFEQTFICS